MRFHRLVLLPLLIMPTAARAGDDSPREAVRQLHEAIERLDRDAVIDSLDIGQSEAQMVLEAMANLLVAGRRFSRAVDERFGEAGQAVAAPMFDRRDLPRLEAAEVRQRGETATVLLPGQARPMQLVRREGRWRVAVGHHSFASEASRARQVRLLERVTQVLLETAERVEQDEFETAEAVAEDVTGILHRVMIEHHTE